MSLLTCRTDLAWAFLYTGPIVCANFRSAVLKTPYSLTTLETSTWVSAFSQLNTVTSIFIQTVLKSGGRAEGYFWVLQLLNLPGGGILKRIWYGSFSRAAWQHSHDTQQIGIRHKVAYISRDHSLHWCSHNKECFFAEEHLLQLFCLYLEARRLR